MLYTLLTIIWIIPVLAGIGALSEKVSGKAFEGISGKVMYGTAVATLIFSSGAFFRPLDLMSECAVSATGLFSFFYFKIYNNFWNLFQKGKLGLPAIGLTTVFFGTYYPFILDHFGYYVPTIKWLNEAGLVKGIANLDLLLGQMSFWHIFQAGFSHFADPFLRINSVALIIYVIYIFEKQSWTHLLFLPVLFLFSQSPSPDLPVIAFSMILLNEIIEKNKNVGQLFWLSVFIFAIKPTMLWLPILVFLYGILLLKESPKFTIAGILVLIFFFFKNIWCFGYPVFPVQTFDLNIPWKPASELMKISSQIAIQKTYDMQYSFKEIQQFTRFDHIKKWLFLPGLKGFIHIAFLITLLVFFIYCLRKKSKLLWLVFISVLIKSALVLVFSAQYRFFIDIFFVVSFLVLKDYLHKKITFSIFSVFAICTLTVLSFPEIIQKNLPSFKLGQFMLGFNKNQMIKPSVFELKKYKSEQIGNLKFNIVKGYPFSFDTPLPAISPEFIREDWDAGIFPQMKGKTLREGFVTKKLTAEEKIRLKNILTEMSK